MSLLRKAMAAEVRAQGRPSKRPTKDELEVLFAYLEGRLSLARVAAALGATSGAAYQWLARVLLRAYRDGYITRTKKSLDGTR